jgi:alkylation response protein AidB-like acyl-CoA dehydrogenase
MPAAPKDKDTPLKNKHGTHAVVTADLSLNVTKAWLIGGVNGGVKAIDIAAVLGVIHMHFAIHSLGNLRRGLPIARSYTTCQAVGDG